MKKLIIILIVILTLVILNSAIYGAVESVLNQTDSEGKSEEAVIQTILSETYATDMLFKGYNQGWQAEYIVDKKLNEDDKDAKNAKALLFSKTDFKGDIWYHIRTTQGYISSKATIDEMGVIKIEENCPIPLVDESIVITIVYGSNVEKVILSNEFPENIISAEEALRLAVKEFFNIYGKYPEETYTFEIDLLDNVYWQISYDDNDGIGGKAYILVDAVEGTVGDIKIEE